MVCDECPDSRSHLEAANTMRPQILVSSGVFSKGRDELGAIGQREIKDRLRASRVTGVKIDRRSGFEIEGKLRQQSGTFRGLMISRCRATFYALVEKDRIDDTCSRR